MAVDLSSGLASLGAGIDSLTSGIQGWQKRSALAALGDQLRTGDYAGAAQKAFGMGDINTGLNILKMGQQKEQLKSTDDYLSRDPTQAASPLPSSAPNPNGGGVPANLLPLYRQAAAETGIPVGLLIAQHRQESGWNPTKIGGAGEIGLGQILPSTARDPGYGLTGVDPESLRDPAANITFSARYFAARAKAAGLTDWNDPAQRAKALTSYNGGGDPNYVSNVTRYITPQPVKVASNDPNAVPSTGDGGASGTDDNATLTNLRKYQSGLIRRIAATSDAGQRAGLEASLSDINKRIADQENAGTLIQPTEYPKYGITDPSQGPYYVGKDGIPKAPLKPNTAVTINQNADKALDKNIIDSIDQSRTQAIGASRTLEAINRQKQALDAGIITGAGADWQTQARSIAAKVLGIPDETLQNTQVFDSAAAAKGAELARAISNSGHTTNADLNVGAAIAGGDRSKTEAAIRAAVQAQEDLARDVINRHNGSVEKFSAINPDAKQRAGWFKVDMPAQYQRATPPAPTTQSRPSGPVSVTSKADYAKIPSGTQYTAPDGSIRVKP